MASPLSIAGSPTQWSLLTLPVSAVTPEYILSSEDLELEAPR